MEICKSNSILTAVGTWTLVTLLPMNYGVISSFSYRGLERKTIVLQADRRSAEARSFLIPPSHVVAPARAAFPTLDISVEKHFVPTMISFQTRAAPFPAIQPGLYGNASSQPHVMTTVHDAGLLPLLPADANSDIERTEPRTLRPECVLICGVVGILIEDPFIDNTHDQGLMLVWGKNNITAKEIVPPLWHRQSA